MRRAHGLSEAVDAGGMVDALEPPDPTLYVVRFTQTVGCEIATADAVGSGVGHEDGETGVQKNIGVACHSQAVVGHAMEKENGPSNGCAGRLQEPGTQRNSILSSQGDIRKHGVAKRFWRRGRRGPACWVKGVFRNEGSCEQGECRGDR